MCSDAASMRVRACICAGTVPHTLHAHLEIVRVRVSPRRRGQQAKFAQLRARCGNRLSGVGAAASLHAPPPRGCWAARHSPPMPHSCRFQTPCGCCSAAQRRRAAAWAATAPMGRCPGAGPRSTCWRTTARLRAPPAALVPASCMQTLRCNAKSSAAG